MRARPEFFASSAGAGSRRTRSPHAHPDHQGASHEVCETLGIAAVVRRARRRARWRTGQVIERTAEPHPINRLIAAGLPRPAAPGRPLGCRKGTTGTGFSVLDVPGHSAGHVAYWRESDRTLICGDVFTNIDPVTGVPGLHEPTAFFTPDPARNRDSMRRLAELEPGAGVLRPRPPAARSGEAEGVHRPSGTLSRGPGLSSSVAMSLRARAWHRGNTFTHAQYPAERLAAEREATVSICLPARDEARTIGPILEQLAAAPRARGGRSDRSRGRLHRWHRRDRSPARRRGP